LPAEDHKMGLERAVAAAEQGLVYADYISEWEEFKKGWSLEDKVQWKNLLKRVGRDVYGNLRLEPPLSSEETVWAENMVRRAEGRGLC
jgi:hypothetical protein